MSLADDIIRRITADSDDALKVAALEVLELAKRNAPVGDPETDPDPSVSLKDSGRIEPDPVTGGWTVYFDTPYAAKIEFDMRLKHPRGGDSRYLQRALAQVSPQLGEIVASRIRRSM